MLGLSTNPTGNKLLEAIGNFIVIFLAELVFLAYGQAQLTGRFPSEFEIYFMALTALATTFVFYGINSKTTKTTKTETNPA